MKNLDEIGTEAAKLLQGMESSRKLAQPLLKQIWEAFDNAKKNKVSITINGATSKSQWAAKCGVTLRHCQYLVRDGSRKRSEKSDANRVRVFDGFEVNIRGYHAYVGEGWVSVEFEKARIDMYKADKGRGHGDWSEKKDKDGVHIWNHKIREIGGNVTFTIEDATQSETQVVAALLKKMREGLKAMHLWDDKLVGEFKEYAKEDAEYQAEQKEERSDRAKRAADTRKRRKALGATRTQKISAAIRDANTDGNSSRAIRAMTQKVQHPAAKALAAAVDGAVTPGYDTVAYAKAENWSQKACVIGSPEHVEWVKDVRYHKEHPAIDPNADDEFAGEGD